MMVGSCCIHSQILEGDHNPKCGKRPMCRWYVAGCPYLSNHSWLSPRNPFRDTDRRCWLEVSTFGSPYRWLEGLAYGLTQHASTSPIPYPWSTHQFASICYDLTGFFLGWVAWNHPNWGVHVTGIHSSNWWPCGQPHHRRYWYVLVLDVDIQQ